jgi:glucose-6-phosphate 1-dehydrogenase
MDYNPLWEGLDTVIEPPPFSIIIFGATGDLTRKKLIPALFSLFIKENITRFKIIGFARRDWNKEKFQNEARKLVNSDNFADVRDDIKNIFLDQIDYIQSSFDEEKGYKEIAKKSEKYPNRLYYLATPPSAYPAIIDKLGMHNLTGKDAGYTRIIIEKPFGKDLASAKELNTKLSKYFSEKQIYRIDHYLGKETVQNIMLLRFGNSIFEPLWNNRHIDHIQLTVAEKIGIGTRGQYYENAGTLRDMVQNHMFQLLSLVAMEPPNNLKPNTIRTEKVKILEALHPITFTKTSDFTIRGQYSDGIIDGDRVPG